MRRTRGGGNSGEKKAKTSHTINEMSTGAYWTRQCDMAAAPPSVRLMTSSDWIKHYQVDGKNADLFQGFIKLYRRFNQEGLGRDVAVIPSIEDLTESPVLCNEHGDGFYGGVAVCFVLVQEREGTRQTKRKQFKNVKAGWPLAFALVYRLWPALENSLKRLPLTYFCHLAADADFAGFGKILINMLKSMFRDTVVCLEISIDDDDVRSMSRQLAIFKLTGFYESLGFISVCDLEAGSLLREFFVTAYVSQWMKVRMRGCRMINLFDANPAAGKWMVLARDNDLVSKELLAPANAPASLLVPEKLGLFRSHAKVG